ncbi:MAG: hypothetical protein NT023_14740 [Armatimonadetes bacterium]|nr:hypothetical protein [Armatimonadota bacterium]
MALQTNVRPEDKPKLIALVVGIIGMIAFVFSRVLGGGQPAQVTTTVATQPASTPPAASLPAGTQVAQNAPAIGDVKALNKDESVPLPFTADPFRPVISTEQKTASTTAHATPTITLKPMGGTRMAQSIMGSGLSVLPPMKVNVSAQPIQEVMTEIVLKGTIEQEKSMAILKMGDKTLYLTEGGRLPGGLVVEKVTAEGVVLRNGNRRTTLTPGQSLKPNTSYLSATGGLQNSF